MSKLLIKNAKVVNPNHVTDADVLISGDMIEQVKPDILAEDVQVIDAKGLHLFPGFIDFHVHLQDKIGEYYIADTYEKGSKVALQSGITTICSFITQKKGMTLKQTIEDTVNKYKSIITTDIHWHLTPTSFSPNDLRDIEELIDNGWNTFKFYTTYKKNGLFSTYEQIESFAKRFSNKEITIMVHCQDDEILQEKQFVKVEDIDSSYSQRAERYAVHRIVEIAERTKVHFHVVHLSNAVSYIESEYVTYETCPQYLIFTDEVYKKSDGYNYLCSPYFGDAINRQNLICLVQLGAIELLSTDHCPFSISDKTQYKSELMKIPNGLCGIDYLIPLAFNVIHDLHDNNLMHLCRLLSTNPARIIGESHNKGLIQSGYFADLILVDIDHGYELKERTNLFNPYQGIEALNSIKSVIRKGKIYS